MQLVQIYFDTASYDQAHDFQTLERKNHFFLQILRDKKLKFEAQLSLIGGTMGLLTGFSVISAVEILFFLVNLVMKSVLFKHRKNAHKYWSTSKIFRSLDFCLPCKTLHIPGMYNRVS